MALTMKDGTDDDALQEAVSASLRTMGVDRLRVEEARGLMAWPLRTVGFATTHLLGAVVRGSPVHLTARELRIYAYATNVSIIGPRPKGCTARAALEREVPFHGAHSPGRTTRSASRQMLEAGRPATASRRCGGASDRIQERIDAVPLAVDEWNVLYRLRLRSSSEPTRGSRDQVRASA